MFSLDEYSEQIQRLSSDQQAFMAVSDRVSRSYEFAVELYRENEVQNLTRIVGAEGFVFGHLIDSIELLQMDEAGDRVVDIGSGCGVPGLLCAILDQKPKRMWFCNESEKGKSQFLLSTISKMTIKNCGVLPGRAEDLISIAKPDTVTARAVGKVSLIAGWISSCSTWNNLILLKGPSWNDEWTEEKNHKNCKKLVVTRTHEYPSLEKRRVNVVLKRK